MISHVICLIVGGILCGAGISNDDGMATFCGFIVAASSAIGALYLVT